MLSDDVQNVKMNRIFLSSNSKNWKVWHEDGISSSPSCPQTEDWQFVYLAYAECIPPMDGWSILRPSRYLPATYNVLVVEWMHTCCDLLSQPSIRQKKNTLKKMLMTFCLESFTVVCGPLCRCLWLGCRLLRKTTPFFCFLTERTEPESDCVRNR